MEPRAVLTQNSNGQQSEDLQTNKQETLEHKVDNSAILKMLSEEANGIVSGFREHQYRDEPAIRRLTELQDRVIKFYWQVKAEETVFSNSSATTHVNQDKKNVQDFLEQIAIVIFNNNSNLALMYRRSSVAFFKLLSHGSNDKNRLNDECRIARSSFHQAAHHYIVNYILSAFQVYPAIYLDTIRQYTTELGLSIDPNNVYEEMVNYFATNKLLPAQAIKQWLHGLAKYIMPIDLQHYHELDDLSPCAQVNLENLLHAFECLVYKIRTDNFTISSAPRITQSALEACLEDLHYYTKLVDSIILDKTKTNNPKMQGFLQRHGKLKELCETVNKEITKSCAPLVVEHNPSQLIIQESTNKTTERSFKIKNRLKLATLTAKEQKQTENIIPDNIKGNELLEEDAILYKIAMIKKERDHAKKVNVIMQAMQYVTERLRPLVGRSDQQATTLLDEHEKFYAEAGLAKDNNQIETIKTSAGIALINRTIVYFRKERTERRKIAEAAMKAAYPPKMKKSKTVRKPDVIPVLDETKHHSDPILYASAAAHTVAAMPTDDMRSNTPVTAQINSLDTNKSTAEKNPLTGQAVIAILKQSEPDALTVATHFEALGTDFFARLKKTRIDTCVEQTEKLLKTVLSYKKLYPDGAVIFDFNQQGQLHPITGLLHELLGMINISTVKFTRTASSDLTSLVPTLSGDSLTIEDHAIRSKNNKPIVLFIAGLDGNQEKDIDLVMTWMKKILRDNEIKAVQLVACNEADKIRAKAQNMNVAAMTASFFVAKPAAGALTDTTVMSELVAHMGALTIFPIDTMDAEKREKQRAKRLLQLKAKASTAVSMVLLSTAPAVSQMPVENKQAAQEKTELEQKKVAGPAIPDQSAAALKTEAMPSQLHTAPPPAQMSVEKKQVEQEKTEPRQKKVAERSLPNRSAAALKTGATSSRLHTASASAQRILGDKKQAEQEKTEPRQKKVAEPSLPKQSAAALKTEATPSQCGIFARRKADVHTVLLDNFLGRYNSLCSATQFLYIISPSWWESLHTAITAMHSLIATSRSSHRRQELNKLRLSYESMQVDFAYNPNFLFQLLCIHLGSCTELLKKVSLKWQDRAEQIQSIGNIVGDLAQAIVVQAAADRGAMFALASQPQTAFPDCSAAYLRK